MTGNEKFRLKVVDDLRKNRVIVESDENYIELLKKANKDLGDLVRERDKRVAELEKEIVELIAERNYFSSAAGEFEAAIVELEAERDGVLDDKERWSIEMMDAAKIAFERTAQITTLKSALRSIANNTCCGDCQEARLVAITALGEEK